MNLIEVMERFPDQESCIQHLERVRWRGTPVCPNCGSIEVKRKKEGGVGRVGRWHCKGVVKCMRLFGPQFHKVKTSFAFEIP